MSVIFRMVPSAGPAISFFDIFKVLGLLCTFKNLSEKLKTNLSGFFAGENVETCLQGRVAMYIALEAAKKSKPEKSEVLIPSFTCESVLFAVKRAQLKPVLYDISDKYPCSDIKEISDKINQNTLAVVSVSMYGMSFNIEEIASCCKQNNVFLIEDIAQAFGLHYQGKPFGVFGDIGVISFGKSKNLSSILGGALVIKNLDLKKETKNFINKLPHPGLLYNIKILTVFLVSFLIIKPFFFKLITLIKKDFTTHDHNIDQPLQKLGKVQESIAFVMIKKHDKTNKIRQKNGRELQDLLKNIPDIKVFSNFEQESIFLRLPIIVENSVFKNQLIQILRSNGYWAMGNSFPPLYEFTGEKHSDFPNTANLDQKLLILPSHLYLQKNDSKKIALIIQKTCEDFQKRISEEA